MEDLMLEEIKELYEEVIEGDDSVKEVKEMQEKIANPGYAIRTMPEYDWFNRALSDLTSHLRLKKSTFREKFSKRLLEEYKVKCSLKDNVIVLDVDYFTQLTQEFNDTLEEYTQMLSTEGFEYESDFLKIKADYETVCNLITTLQDLNALFNAESEIVEEESYTQIMVMLEALKENYEQFFILKQFSESTLISFETISYILDNCSLLPLVYANNNGQNISGKQSLYRFFSCQFHLSNDKSLRVSIPDNYFNCFGCGLNGNALDYLVLKESLTYEDALYLLAEIYYLDMPNPMKTSPLVDKYRWVIVSDEYRTFLQSAYTDALQNEKISAEVKNKYLKALETVERVRKGEYDSNFVYKEKAKRYLCDFPSGRIRKLYGNLRDTSKDNLPF